MIIILLNNLCHYVDLSETKIVYWAAILCHNILAAQTNHNDFNFNEVNSRLDIGYFKSNNKVHKSNYVITVAHEIVYNDDDTWNCNVVLSQAIYHP